MPSGCRLSACRLARQEIKPKVLTVRLPSLSRGKAVGERFDCGPGGHAERESGSQTKPSQSGAAPFLRQSGRRQPTYPRAPIAASHIKRSSAPASPSKYITSSPYALTRLLQSKKVRTQSTSQSHSPWGGLLGRRRAYRTARRSNAKVKPPLRAYRTICVARSQL